MKVKLLFIAVLSTIAIFSQTQVGGDIDGEAAGDYSGWSVSLSSNGNIIAIGAPWNDGNGISSGHVRVYENFSGVWTQIGADIEGEAELDYFGRMVSLSSDGSILAIGAHSNSALGNLIGYVRVYQNISGVWTQIGTDIEGEAAEDYSGESISLSSNGNIIAIGAPLNDGNGINSGHTRVFENISGVWTQIGTDINGEAEYDNSGRHVSLSSDGNTVAIGAPFNDENGIDSGHVRVYQNISGVWTQIGADIDGEAEGDFASSVSLSSNGNILAIGAQDNDGNGTDSGHVRVYQNTSGVWTKIGADIDGEAAVDHSGWSVSLSSDGSILAIGSRRNDGNGPQAGHVRIYLNIIGVWTQLGSDIDGEEEYDNFGYSTSLSSDGSIIAIGSRANDSNGIESGHVRVYDLSVLLSLEDNEISKNLTVFPNPVNKILQVHLTPTIEYKKVTIYNYFGEQVLESKTSKINVSSLSTGVYFLKVETNKGKGVKKFIKK